jgi:hypothetical protein
MQIIGISVGVILLLLLLLGAESEIWHLSPWNRSLLGQHGQI